MTSYPEPTDDDVASFDWRDRYPWLILLGTFRLAVSPSVLLLAAVGAVAGSLGWRLAEITILQDEVIAESASLPMDVAYLGALPGERNGSGPLGGDRWSATRPVVAWTGPWPDSPLLAVPYRILRPCYQLLQRHETWGALGYYLWGGAWTLAVWSLLGAAISRIAVMRLGREERAGLTSSARFALPRVGTHLAAVLMPLMGILLLSLPLALLGLVMRSNFGVVVAGITWILVLPVALVMSLLAVGWLFAWPLMWGALSCEGLDAFDAVSRSFSYALQRPLKYLWYAALSVFLGLLGWLVVWGVSELVLALASWGVSLGAGSARMEQIGSALTGESGASGMVHWGAQAIGFGNAVVRTLATAYAYSYFWCAYAGIYLLLRYDVDSTELDQVYCEEFPDTVYERGCGQVSNGTTP